MSNPLRILCMTITKDNSSEIFKEILTTEEVNPSSEDSDIEMDYCDETMRSIFIPGNTFPILKRFQTQTFSPEN